MCSTPREPDPISEIARLRRERDLLVRLIELGSRDTAVPFVEDALSLAVDVVGARQGYLALAGAAGGASPRLSVTRGLSADELDAVRGEISSGIIAQAVATGRTISTASAVDDPRFADHASVQAARIRAVVCAPIVVAARPLGVLYLSGRQSPGPFGEPERQIVELFARQLGPLAERVLAQEEDSGQIDHTEALRARLSVDRIAGRSRAIADVLRQVLVAAPVPVAVLITGQSGTGKTEIARALHDSSPRAAAPFVELNCAAIAEALFESELFGAEKGAHSTATRRIEGKIDAARGGTLFLDEVSEIPLAVQGKLLQFLQSRRYYRLGAATPLTADVRVVAATHADLEQLVAHRRFREDLYYRLDVLQVRVPALRDRPEDIGPIAERIVHNLGAAHGRPIGLSRAARVALTEAEWPGNVRQLENSLSRAWALALSEEAIAIEPRHVFPDRSTRGEPADVETASYQEATRRFQQRFVREALESSGWNVSETARRIGVARSHLNDLIRAFGLVRTPAAATSPRNGNRSGEGG